MQSDRNPKTTPIRAGELPSDPASSPLRFTDTGTTSPQDNARINSFGLRGSSVSPIAPHFASSVHSSQSDLHLSTTPVVHRSTLAVGGGPGGPGGGPLESFSTYRPLFPDMSMLRADSREDRLRLLRSDAQQMNLTKAAIFYAEKIMAITDDATDVYWLAQAYYDSNQYERALDLLNKKKTLNKSVHCRYLAGLCANALENWRDALDYLGPENPFADKDFKHDTDMEGRIKLESIMCYVRGNAYLQLKEIEKAKKCFKEALSVDALEALFQYNMLDERAEWDFIMTLPYDEHCGQDADLFRSLYMLHLKRHSHTEELQEAQARVEEDHRLSKSLDVMHSTAEALLAESKFEECAKVCEQIEQQDALYTKSIPAYVTCLYELGEKSKLYELAQDLVDKLNDNPISWYAVGIYYMYIKRYGEARRYFSQATTMDPYFEASWLGYGHAFAAENDHDQAINAYLTCSKLIPGSHLPYLYIGMEYMKQNLVDTAHEYYKKSLLKCTTDPYLMNEFCTLYYRKEEYTKALEFARKALKFARNRQSEKSALWPKLWSNLGHIYRRMGDYDRALRCFNVTLIKDPHNADAHGAIGIIYYLQGKYSDAVTKYQEALRNSKSSSLLLQLIDRALMQSTKEPIMSAIYRDHRETDDLFAPLRKTPLEDIELKKDYLEEEIAALDAQQQHQMMEDGGGGGGGDAHSPKDTTTSGSIVDEESLLIDEGDLRPNMSREWL
ncbi:hypothetical protein O0I10_009961 [Lichtheimia ornata]|uniref:Anaphase-promoting complex subunit 6 n=1 Tax=Lichtheimia ornata TaxID=688661 RepID=A0AAD7UVP0_9FUNG|nr:uncharacterized protein O0I10_009961 [Lichtheimia ornata]KAJ8654393.1 hypothetical protein O0I10_009961 [Lichtheimia ornata]